MMRTLVLVLVCLSQVGCANFGRKFKNFIRGKSDAPIAKPAPPSYSNNANMDYKGIPRKYKRMTQAKLEAENKINDGAGSLWVAEGQGSYLFAQNNQRLVGDIVNVSIDGTAKRQLDTKVGVIEKLIKQRRLRAKLASKPKSKQAASSQPTAPPAAGAAAGGDDKASGGFAVKEVPSRIVETFPDGSYRIRGSKDFMIDRTEYKVIVTGVVKPGDISDSKVESDKVLDGKFDIVSQRRSLKL
jgi:flagellar L-ring protein precursor FlgH